MNACAIVSEYNPLHRGHRYQLERARELSGCGRLVAIMSGHFTQRGIPAVADKWERARAALAAGADLVLELPAGYALQPAEWFARGAVGILSDLGVVTHLSFGAETDDPELLRELAALLLREPEALSRSVKKHLALGLSHPAARSAAVGEYLRETAGEERADAACAALRCPNNILGILYMQALTFLSSPIRPVVVRRAGKGYHDPTIGEAFASATAVRQAIFDGRPWRRAVPETTAAALDACFARGHGPADWRDFEKMLLYRLRTMSAGELERLPDMAEGLDRRIAAAAARGGSFAEFLGNAKVRRYASARLQRAAVHALLGMTGDDVRAFRAELPRYARVLGFREEARPLLARMGREARIPVVTRPGRFRPADAATARLWALDVRATDVYSLALSHEKDRRSGRDFTQPLIRFP